MYSTKILFQKSIMLSELITKSRLSHKLNLYHEWPFNQPFRMSNYSKIRSSIVIFLVGCWGKFIINTLNRPKVFNKDIILDAIFSRPKETPLITVLNHESCIDDPCFISMLMTKRQLLMNRDLMRWTLVAHDICYTREWHSWIFSNGKGVPVVRGLGVYQKAVDFAIDRLNEGDWVHIFPEGRVNMERKELYRLKWGVGRIISDCNVLPIVIPLHLYGMADVLPNKKPYIPLIGKNVILNVGEPINLEKAIKSTKDKSAMEKRKSITDVIQAEMAALRLKTLQLVNKENLSN